MLTPPMPYSGGKQRVAKQIVDLFPPHAGYRTVRRSLVCAAS